MSETPVNPVHLPLDIRKEFRGLSIESAKMREHPKYGTVYCVVFAGHEVWFRCTGKYWSEFTLTPKQGVNL